MPLQNRVTPLGELIADPARGLVYGNRGCLHDEHGRIRRRYNGKRWIACRLEFRGWHRNPLLQPGRFTELFFLDEATAFAAGHRPCALCRREDYVRFGEIWRELHPGRIDADAIDERLHDERVNPETRRQLHHRASLDELPDGAFVLQDVPWLVLGSELIRWTPAGYADRRRRPHGEEAPLITPPSFVPILRSGWQSAVPLLHPSAQSPLRQLAVRAPGVAEPEARPGTEAGHPVAGIGELAAIEGEAPAADALSQTGLEAAELCDSLVDPRFPAPGEVRPVAAPWGSVARKPRELDADFLEREPDTLGEDDEGDSAKDRSRIAAVARTRPLGVDEPPLLVEAQGRCGNAAATGDLPDREQV